MYKNVITLITAALLGIGATLAQAASAWQGITVNVKADQPVATTQQVSPQADGFTRLQVTLANEGTVPLTIDTITVRIPLPEKTTPETNILFGVSAATRKSSYSAG